MSKKMIVVNARMLRKDRLDGTGWFAFETLRRITAAHPEIRFLFLFDRPFDTEFLFSENVTGRVVYPPIRHGLLYYPWYQIGVKRILQSLTPDLFLSPDGLLPLGVKCKQLAVIHDLNFHYYPQDLPYWTSRYFNRYYPAAVKAANRIATVSEYTKRDLIKTYHADPEKIDVVYNGVQDGFAPVPEEEKKRIRDQYTDGENYFLFIGSLHPRKNVPRLLEAFEQCKKQRDSRMKLVIAGSLFWGKKEIDAALKKMSARQDIIFTGRTSDRDLNRLMAGAFCLTFVPYFEGFGLPLLEAMQSDVPIISGNTTSLPEVAGNAALYVDPFTVEEIAAAMTRMTTDVALRQSLIEHGRIQRQKFSWEKTAEKLWSSIEKTFQ